MKIRHLRPWRALTTAVAALCSVSAFGQIVNTNTLLGNYVYPTTSGDSSKPGFVWNAYQVSTGPALEDIAGFESELVGNSGPNLVDPGEIYSSASATGTVTGTNDPVTFIIPGGNVGGLETGINFNIQGSVGNPDCSDNMTNLPCEDGLVGTPGVPTDAGGGNDNYVAEALTYLSLPAGKTVMGVRSDDGFQLQIGAANPGDRYSSNAQVVTEFNGTRGFGDNWVTLNVPKAGLYAARLLYFNGGGDSSVEWYSFPPAGTTNVTLGTANTGTNAVLIGDTADSGIPAYRALTVAPLASYCSSINPTPGSVGVSVEPTITAQIVNGATAVSGITLSIDGTTVTPTITTTGTGATVTYTAEAPLQKLNEHTISLAWTDNGNHLGVTSQFAAVAYVTLDPSTIVTPNTNKPGFKFNVFANGSDPFATSVNGVQGGETEFLDNIELGLNGLVPDGAGGFLPNEVTLSSAGPASGPAPALGGPNEPAQFIVTNVIDMQGGNLPGFPAADGGTDPSHIEILTYVYLPAGLTVFDLNLDGWYRAFVQSWDYTKAVEAGSIFNAVTGDTTFTVSAPTNGYYPLRITALNTDGTPNYSLYTLSHGVKTLVGDVANGGSPAYYELSTPAKPYIRYVSPRNVPHRMLYGYNQVIVRIQDGDSAASDSSIALNMDGNNVTLATTRTSDVTQSVWTPTTLQTPAEIHTAILTYQDNASDSLSNYWNFQNLRAIFLPTAAAGYWLPTNAIATETFEEYADPTEFTNDTPTGNWYTSPQPYNDLVDVAPIFNHPIAGPTNWYVWNWDAPSGDPGFNASDANSDAYANFLCIDLNSFSTIEGSSLNTAPYQWINGVPLVQLVANQGQNVLIAESDNRSGSSPGQTQFAMSKSFNLSSAANPVVAFAAIVKQNQDDLHTVEYSIDGGAHWWPVFYSQDGHTLGSDPPDLQINLDNTVNVQNSFFSDGSNPGEVPTWIDSTGDFNNTFGAGIGAPITQALAPFMCPRINDDNYDGREVEVVRLPLAAHQSNVRLRVSQIGSCSWYGGITQIAFYDVPLSGAFVPTGMPATTPTGSTLSVTASAGSVTVTWTGSGTLQKASSLTGSASDWSAVTPAPSGNTYTAPIGAGNLFFRLVGN